MLKKYVIKRTDTMKILFIIFIYFGSLFASQQTQNKKADFQIIINENQKTGTSLISYVDYFPLSIGNFWEYIEDESVLSSRTKEVIKDTLMSNGKTYKKVLWQYCANSVLPMPEIELLRKDSIGNIYSFFDNQDHLLYDFTGNVLDTMSAPWPGYYWEIRNKYQVVAFEEETLKAIDMALYNPQNQQSFFITFVENYGITFYTGERNRQAGDYIEGTFWGSVIDGFQRKELLITKSHPDWEKYYPLQIGNKWIYEETYWVPIKDTLILEVVKDTLLEDNNIYKKIRRTYLSILDGGAIGYYYERMDSMGQIFRREQNEDYEGRPVLKFSACIGDTIPLYWDTSTYRILEKKYRGFWEILNGYEYTLFFWDPASLAGEDQFFVKNIGLIEKHNEGIFNYLLGAYVNGIIYGDTTITYISEKKNNPQKIALFQNYPNPFNPTTVIPFYLPKSEIVTLKIYDLSGREVKSLLNNQGRRAGRHEVIWNGKNNAGKEVSSGVYFYSLFVKNLGFQTKKVIYIK